MKFPFDLRKIDSYKMCISCRKLCVSHLLNTIELIEINPFFGGHNAAIVTFNSRHIKMYFKVEKRTTTEISNSFNSFSPKNLVRETNDISLRASLYAYC